MDLHNSLSSSNGHWVRVGGRRGEKGGFGIGKNRAREKTGGSETNMSLAKERQVRVRLLPLISQDDCSYGMFMEILLGSHGNSENT